VGNLRSLGPFVRCANFSAVIGRLLCLYPTRAETINTILPSYSPRRFGVILPPDNRGRRRACSEEESDEANGIDEHVMCQTKNLKHLSTTGRMGAGDDGGAAAVPSLLETAQASGVHQTILLSMSRQNPIE